MIRLAGDSCGGCEYVKALDDHAPSRFVCRRYPPDRQHQQPAVGPDDWCGEYMPVPTLDARIVERRRRAGG